MHCDTLVATLAESHKEIVRFDVAMDEIPWVDILNATDHRVGEKQHRLDTEFARAKVK